MTTKKPQFSCYLDPAIDAEIESHLKKSGQAKGKLVEQLWRFYNFRDQNLMFDRFATRFTRELSEQDIVFARRLVTLLQNALRGETK